MTRSSITLTCLLSAFAALSVVGRPAAANTNTWDNGTLNVSGPTDGGGNWLVSGSNNWWNGSGYSAWNSSNTAQFGFASGHTTAYTVTLDPAGVTAAGIVFQDRAYTLSGSTLTLGGSSPTITVNRAAGGTISSVLAGTAGLLKTGTGSLTLSGANIYTGGTTISQGTIVAGGASALPTGTITLGDANSGTNAITLSFGGNTFSNPITVANLGSGTASLGQRQLYRTDHVEP